MIQFLSDILDQMDLALDQLGFNDRNYDRFALMLVDNVTELVLHKHAQDRAADNDMWAPLGEVKYDKKKVSKALGRNFDSKVKLAKESKLVTNKLAQSILNLHAFRNTAYHKGYRHEIYPGPIPKEAIIAISTKRLEKSIVVSAITKDSIPIISDNGKLFNGRS